MFSFFGSEKNENWELTTTKTLKLIVYLNKNIQNWAKTLQYLPIVFIDTPFLPYVG